MQTLPIRQLGFLGAAVLLAGTLVWLGPGVTAQVSINDDDIGGVVRGAGGPEAGVWVIAETDAFDTLYRKIVVTDDAGRYVLPDLPDAQYRVWVRGYGLKDSEPVTHRPGTTLDLRAVRRRVRARRLRSSPPTTGIRWSRCRMRVSSREPDRRATESHPACGTRQPGSTG